MARHLSSGEMRPLDIERYPLSHARIPIEVKRRIGIIGGSFDPIHHGHLLIAEDAAEQFELDLTLFVPAYHAPLKDKKPRATPEQRYAMVEAAIADNPRFAISDADFRHHGISYSIDTVARLENDFPSSQFFWILGADQLSQLHRWQNIEELSRRVAFIAFERETEGRLEALESLIPEDLPQHAQVHFAQSHAFTVSSTEIRERLQCDKSVKYFLPPSVFDYIKARNLYR